MVVVHGTMFVACWDVDASTKVLVLFDVNAHVRRKFATKEGISNTAFKAWRKLMGFRPLFG
jgi:hypothetical protein